MRLQACRDLHTDLFRMKKLQRVPWLAPSVSSSSSDAIISRASPTSTPRPGTPPQPLCPVKHTTPDEPSQIVLETPRPPRLLSRCVPGMLSPPRDNRRTSSRPPLRARPLSPPKIPDRSPYPDEDEGVGLNQFVAQGVSKLRDAFGFRSASGGSTSSGASATVGGTAGGVAGSSGPPTKGEQGSDQRAVAEDLPRTSAKLFSLLVD